MHRPKKRRERAESDDSALFSESSSEDARESSQEEGESTVAASPSLLGRKFGSWEEFNSAFEAYCRETRQTFAKRTSATREARNARIRAVYAKNCEHAPDDKLLVDAAFSHYLVSFECFHGGKHRARGKGKRPRQNVRSVGCKAKLNALLRREGERYYIVVSLHDTVHNHRIGDEEYNGLPKNRMRLPDTELDTVNLLRKVGVSRKKILKYFWDNTDSEPSMVDVHNLLAKLKREEEAGTTLEQRISETLDRFCEKDEIAVAHVDFDRQQNKYIARFITIQSSHMRSLFSAFPEALLVDATHDTNVSKYKLFSFMVHDAFGHGQHVQHSLITDERKETLRHSIKQFKKNNPAWNEVRRIVVDKDFTEIGVFREEMALARVLLCQFHAIKYIKERIGKTEYGLDAIQRERLKPMASLIVRAESEEEYEKCFDFMKQQLGVADLDDEDAEDVPEFGDTFWITGAPAAQCGAHAFGIMRNILVTAPITDWSHHGKKLRQLFLAGTSWMKR